MKVPSLQDLAASEALKDLDILKCYAQYLPKAILYVLVKKCFFISKKRLAFSLLIQNWPLPVFSMQDIGIELKEDDVIFIASLIQKRLTGSIQCFDLLYDKFGQLDTHVTDALVRMFLSNAPLLSINHYGPVASTSYSRAIDLACGTTCLRCDNNVMMENEIVCKIFNTEDQIYSSLAIKVELVVNSDNVDNVIELCKRQESTSDKSCNTQLLVCSLQFQYTFSKKIAKVLASVDQEKLEKVDLSFNCLSQGKRLKYICCELKNIRNLSTLCISFNTISSYQCHTVAECLQMLPKLQYLNCSFNRLGDGLVDILSVGVQSHFLTALIISGCEVTKSVVNALLQSNNLHHLQKLKIDQNHRIGREKKLFLLFLEKLIGSLQYLDISSCAFPLKDLISICPVLCKLQYLRCLVVWPNPGVTANTINDDILPLLKSLKHLKTVPPIGDVAVPSKLFYVA